MYQAIKSYCDDQQKKNGLFLIDMPTGSGKTYTVSDYIYEIAMDDTRVNQKVFFITTQKKNLPTEDLRKRFARSGQMARFKEKCLFIDSNADCVVENLSDAVIREIPENIKKTPEFQALEFNVKLIRILSSDTDSNALSEVAQVKEELWQNTEPAFRRYVSKLICDQFPTVQARLHAVHTSQAWQWLGKLYPAVFTRERQIISMSIDKFLSCNCTIVEPSYTFYQSNLLNDAIIFIDEFDATKETLLKNIIQKGIRDRVDCLELFRNIVAALQPTNDSPVPRILSQYQQYSESTCSAIVDLRQRAAALYNAYPFLLNATGTETNTQNHARCLIFDGGQNATTMLSSRMGMGFDDRNVREILNQLQGFFLSFRKCVCILARQKQRQPNGNTSAWEKAIRAALSDFGLRWSQIDYLATEILMDSSNCNFPFYESGFRYLALENDGTHDLPSKITVCTFRTTPEQILLQMCKKAQVVGISASASVESVIGNYDIAYLKSKLGTNYHSITAADKKRLHEKFAADTKGYENVSIHVDFVSGLVDGAYSVKAWKQVFSNEAVAQNIFEGLERRLPQNQSSHHKQRYVKIALAYKAFVRHADIQSFLCLLTKHPKKGDPALALDVLLDIFAAIARENAAALPVGFLAEKSVVLLDGKKYDRKKEELTRRLSQGEKLFVISAYQTIGAGQNLQYPVPEGELANLIQTNGFAHRGEKDIDAIYLDKPTHLIVNLSNPLSEEGLVKYLFQVAFLQQNAELSANDALQHIKKAFHCYATQQVSNVHAPSAYQKESIMKYLTMMLMQAIGRICRTNLKKPNIYIMADACLIDALSQEVADGRLLNPEFAALLAAAKGGTFQAHTCESVKIPAAGPMNSFPLSPIGNNPLASRVQTRGYAPSSSAGSLSYAPKRNFRPHFYLGSIPAYYNAADVLCSPIPPAEDRRGNACV